MFDYKCSVCGGKLNITIGSDIAVCESCNNRTEIPNDEVKKYSDIYKSAETLVRQNSVTGYKSAIRELNTISFIPEAEAKIAECERHIAEIQAKQKEQKQIKRETDKQDTKTGVIIIALIVLVLLLAVAVAAYIAFHLYRGDLSPRAMTAIIITVAVFIIAAVIGKIKS